MKDTKYSIFVIGFILLYFLVGMITGFLGANQIFPFSAWDLFEDIPNRRNDYGVIIMSYNGKIVSPPKLFQDSKDITPEYGSIIAYRLIQNFGKAYDRSDTQEAERLRAIFEANYMKAPARYSLVKLVYDPVERWKTGKYETAYIRVFSVRSEAL